MLYSGDPISITDDRLPATDDPARSSPAETRFAALRRVLKRLGAALFRDDQRELRQIADNPRMLDDIGLTRGDVERVLHRQRGQIDPERYSGWL